MNRLRGTVSPRRFCLPKALLRKTFEDYFTDLPNVEIVNGYFEDLPFFDCIVTAANSTREDASH